MIPGSADILSATINAFWETPSVANTFGFGELSQVYGAKSSLRKVDRKIAGYGLRR
jgi:hypothetical protein